MAVARKGTNVASLTTLEVGQAYLFESAGKLWLGRILSIDGPFSVTLEDASWVAETGRYHQFVRDGQAQGMEIEPVGTKGLRWDGWEPWSHPLPRQAV